MFDREIVVVRHGEALANVAGVMAGDTCQGLTSRGRRQAELVARRLGAERRTDTRLYVSSVPRARQTGDPIAEQLNVAPIVDHDLRVPDPGPFADGRPWSELRSRWSPDPDHPSRPLIEGGESWRQYTERAHARLDALLASHPGGRMIIVAHSETVVSLFTLLLDVNALARLPLHTDHTGITHLCRATERPGVPPGPHRWALTRHNDKTHLAARQ